MGEYWTGAAVPDLLAGRLPAGSRALGQPKSRPVSESLREYGRGIAGGLLFSLPLVYTSEVWAAGFTIPAERQLAYLLATFVLLLGYNRYSGLHPDTRWSEILVESVEELGIGLVLSLLILLALGRIGPHLDLDESIGRVVVEAFTIAIVVSVGTAQLGGDPSSRDSDKRQVGFGGQLVLGGCGAVLFAANMAPTEEIVTVGLEMPPLQLAGLAGLSLLLALLVLFYSDFRGARRWVQAEGAPAMLRAGVVTYAVALVSSAVILWLFGRFDHVPAGAMLGETVALAFPATLGASAGRLLLQQ